MIKLGIVTLAEESGQFYKEQIDYLFEGKIETSNFSFEKANIDNIGNFNIVLVSTSYQHELIRKYLSPNTTVIIGKVTLSREGFNLLKTFDKPVKAMYVNQNLEMAVESISLIYSIGFKNFEFVPVYPDIEKVPILDIAFTNGESKLVPDGIKKIVDLGHRILDKNTIVELAYALSQEETLNSKIMKDYFENTISIDNSVELLLNKSSYLENQICNLLEIMDKGVIIADHNNKITNINNYIGDKMNISLKEVIGKSSKDVFPDIDFEKAFYDKLPVNNKLIRIKKTLYSCSIYPINEHDDYIKGAIAILEDFTTTEKKQNNLRLQLMNKGHIAKYTVEDIKYKSEEMTKITNIIKLISNSDSSVLITGESGTGKELIAQSIHNMSKRKESHFIAINCAALPESILESELFGYTPGTFTGALNKGKIGIFEMANNGTLFLDEIGEIPIKLQSRLLRVLQEREIMRLGGDEVIKINIRIIAATNCDLFKKIKEGQFRKDLFYRLNVMPIKVPPLRERREDIMVLFKHFKNEIKASFKLDKKAENLILDYDWDGNIREVENCVEYLYNLNKEVIFIDDLPYYILDSNINSSLSLKIYNNDFNIIFDELKDKYTKYIYVLQILMESFNRKERIGRRGLSEKAFNDNMFISEYELRSMLRNMEQFKLVTAGKGREGTCITDKGIDYLKWVKQDDLNTLIAP